MKTYKMDAPEGKRLSQTRRKKLIAKKQKVWLGLDVSKKNVAVTVLEADNEKPLYQQKLPRGKQHIEGLFDKLPGCEVWACYEAGPTGYKTLRWLRECGAEAIMVPPSLVPTKGGNRVKTDRRDSYTLARCLRGGMLDPVHDLTDEQYEHREVMRTYRQKVETRSDVCRQIKSKLLFHGIQPPEQLQGSNWSEAYLTWLESSPSGREWLDMVFAEMAADYRRLTKSIKRMKKGIKQLAKQEYAEEVELLTTAPGVGLITAMTFLTELGDLDRFDNCEQFSSYLGMIPWENSSGQRTSRGGLTRTGNKRVRTALVEASWQVKSKAPHLEDVYDRIRARNGDDGSKIAIVAVARRLGLALRAMLRQKEGYKFE